jgi:hypothetical protein
MFCFVLPRFVAKLDDDVRFAGCVHRRPTPTEMAIEVYQRVLIGMFVLGWVSQIPSIYVLGGMSVVNSKSHGMSCC